MDQEALTKQVDNLHRRYGGMVRRRAMALLGRKDLVEDVTQDVFVRVIENLERFRGESSPVTWLYRITTNLCLDRLRQRARRRPVELTEELEHALAFDQRSPTAESRVASREQLADLLRRSDQQTLQIFVHAFMDEMSQEEIAAAIGVSRKTVWTKLDRLRKRLRAGLKERA